MRYDGTTLRDGEHELIVYKVNERKAPVLFAELALCSCTFVSASLLARSAHTRGVTAAIIKASL